MQLCKPAPAILWTLKWYFMDSLGYNVNIPPGCASAQVSVLTDILAELQPKLVC